MNWLAQKYAAFDIFLLGAHKFKNHDYFLVFSNFRTSNLKPDFYHHPKIKAKTALKPFQTSTKI